MDRHTSIRSLFGGTGDRYRTTCPHCGTAIAPDPIEADLATDAGGNWAIEFYVCTNPECRRLVLHLLNGTPLNMMGIPGYRGMEDGASRQLVYPRAVTRRALGKEVPPDYVRERDKAAAVLADSPEASAALTRRALQRLLASQAGTTKRDLFDQIQEVLDSSQLPPYLAEQIDGIRVIANFGAHPLKSTNTGEMMAVEPGEAEWNLTPSRHCWTSTSFRPPSVGVAGTSSTPSCARPVSRSCGRAPLPGGSRRRRPWRARPSA